MDLVALRSVVVGGRSYEAGDVIHLPVLVAGWLLACGAAAPLTRQIERAVVAHARHATTGPQAVEEVR